jgi:hypothetical protein
LGGFDVAPATTSDPFACRARANASSTPAPIDVVAEPEPLKDVSRSPGAATAKPTTIRAATAANEIESLFTQESLANEWRR